VNDAGPASRELFHISGDASLVAAAAPEDDHHMDQVEQDFGKPNPNAPAALSRFAFLIGKWTCDARVRLADGAWQTLQGTWVRRFILDGYAIADEYRMTGASEELIVLGLNLRTYDGTTSIWNMKWLNALAGTWVDLGPEELGGISFDGQSIIYAFREPMAAVAASPEFHHELPGSHETDATELAILIERTHEVTIRWPRADISKHKPKPIHPIFRRLPRTIEPSTRATVSWPK
jgi:hypothetical protein